MDSCQKHALPDGNRHVFAWALALPLGVWSAQHIQRFPDFLISSTTAGLLVIPDLALALGLLLFAVRSGWFPTGGLVSIGFEGLSPTNRLHDLARHMFLPVLVLVLSFLPLLVRHVRAAMVGVLGAPFLRAARGHGISRRRLLYRYALPAAANPLISLFGFSIGVLLSGSLLVEVVMSWPGLGPFLVEAILSRDLYVVFGGILLSALFLVVGNFVADLFLYRADPRIRTEARHTMTSYRKLEKWLVVLVALHGVIACGGFFAPYDPVEQDREHAYAPPMRLHLVDRQGKIHAASVLLPAPPQRRLGRSI